MQLQSGPATERDLGPPQIGRGEESLIIVQTLLCMPREKNLLNRADIEEWCHRVEERVEHHDNAVMPCSLHGAVSASTTMQRLSRYLGRRYGGRHGRHSR